MGADYFDRRAIEAVAGPICPRELRPQVHRDDASTRTEEAILLLPYQWRDIVAPIVGR